MARFRNRDRSNRSGRGQVEHNVLEGLPINQFREVEVTVGASAGDSRPADKDAWPELPMPRDSHMLPEHSRQMLRAARAGRLYRPPVPVEDDNEIEDEEKEHKEVPTGFTIKKYVKISRHLETAEPEYLAKRRKGLPSQYVMNGAAQPAMRETMVKKLDADGNAMVYKVLVPEGQAVEGEVQPTDDAIEVAPATAAPGTIVEGVGVVNAQGVVVANDIVQQTPPRRRQPPPKKRRGIGRGRRKVGFVGGAATRATADPNAGHDYLAVPGAKQQNGSVEPSDGDTSMADVGGEDEEGSGDEGSDDEDHDGEHTFHPSTPATSLRPIDTPTTAPIVEAAEISTLDSSAAASITAPSVTDCKKNLQPPVEVKPPSLPTVTPGLLEQSTTGSTSSSPTLLLSTGSPSRQNSSNTIPTSATADEPEPIAVDTNETVEPATVVPPVSSLAVLDVNEPQVSQELSAENPSAPPSEPDLMASLDRHLKKNSEDIASS